MDKESYIDRILAVAKHKYDLDEEVVLSFAEEIEWCWKNSFGPIRAVEFIVEKIF